tara:strand:- start:658 stop:1749 length:1092 start_codon:yes stop_codon:yes gene_type:complete
MIQNFINHCKSIDKTSFFITLFLILFGTFLIGGSDLMRAGKSFNVLNNHTIAGFIGILIILFISFQNNNFIYRFSLIGISISLIVMIIILFLPFELYGKKKWINIFGILLKPSEFLVPFFIIFSARCFSDTYNTQSLTRGFKYGKIIAYLTFFLCFVLLMLQPNLSMIFILTVIFFLQVFVAGLPILIITLFIIIGFVITMLLYVASIHRHIARRIDTFLDPTQGDTFQISESLKAFMSGGIFGKGPGQGILSERIPDASSTFIFSSIGEEFGLIGCIFLLILFSIIIFKGLLRAKKINDRFVYLSIAGLLFYFAFQVILNIFIALNLIPQMSAGLPFLSIDLSLMLSNCILMGCYLNISKRE